MNSKPTYLFVIPSTVQMYSGTGTVVFDWIKFAKSTFEFSIAMDTQIINNFMITSDFCKKEDINFFPSLATNVPGTPDLQIQNLPLLLSLHEFTFVECVSWANAATNGYVIANWKNQGKLLFTPHWQPAETLENHHSHFLLKPVFDEMLLTSDFIFADSTWEMQNLLTMGADPAKVHVVLRGVSTEQLARVGSIQETYFLAVGDFLEKRKRFDLLLSLYQEYVQLGGNAQLLLVGNGSSYKKIPASLNDRVVLVGYVSREELQVLYSKAMAYISSSEYEAFGLTIAESLTCGTPVFLNKTAVLESIYSGLLGVNFFENEDLRSAAIKLLDFRVDAETRDRISSQAMGKFSFQATYGTKLRILLESICEQ